MPRLKWNWPSLMVTWNRDILNSELKSLLPVELVAKGWLGQPGANEEQLKRVEDRLRISLPPSYRSFMIFSNGWDGVLTHSIDRLWSTEQIDWFAKRHTDWIEGWFQGATLSGKPLDDNVSDEEYLDYTVNTHYLKSSHLKTALEISSEGDAAIMLLDPKVVNKTGEWEAWFFANWVPGARRYPSFWAMMQSEHKLFLKVEKEKVRMLKTYNKK